MYVTDAKRVAEDVINSFWTEGKFPVDPVRIAKSMGIEVLKIELPPEVSGAISKKAGADPIIYIQHDDHPVRMRFTCAHELGHYFQRLGEDTYEWVDLRDLYSGAGEIADEVFANSFAANLLMPEKEFKAVAKHANSAELMAYFGVSGVAIKWRLKNLNLVHREFVAE